MAKPAPKWSKSTTVKAPRVALRRLNTGEIAIVVAGEIPLAYAGPDATKLAFTYAKRIAPSATWEKPTSDASERARRAHATRRFFEAAA